MKYSEKGGDLCHMNNVVLKEVLFIENLAMENPLCM